MHREILSKWFANSKYFIIAVLILSSSIFNGSYVFAEPEKSGALTHRNGDFLIVWSGSYIISVNLKSTKVVTIFETEDTEHLKDDNEGYWSRTGFEVLSIVGNYLSMKSDWYAEGGAHPSYGKRWRTIDISSGKPVSLTDFFTKKVIYNALIKDKVIKNSIRNKTVKNLDELLNNADGGCSAFISEDLLTQFAFHHVNGNKVAVRIGLSHGCEVARGNFTQLGIYLPIPNKLKSDIARASRHNTLMKYSQK